MRATILSIIEFIQEARQARLPVAYQWCARPAGPHHHVHAPLPDRHGAFCFVLLYDP